MAYSLGTDTIVEPRLRIGLNHESSQQKSFRAVVAEAKVSGSAKLVSLQHDYDSARMNDVLKQLNMTMVQELPHNIENVSLNRHTDMGGEGMHAICSKIWKLFMLKKDVTRFSQCRSGRGVVAS